MLDAAVPAAFENIGKARDVGIDICFGPDQRIPYSSLRGKVDDFFEALRLKQACNALAVRKVHLKKAKTRVAGQPGEPGFFEINIVIAAEIVNPDNLFILGSVEQ